MSLEKIVKNNDIQSAGAIQAYSEESKDISLEQESDHRCECEDECYIAEDDERAKAENFRIGKACDDEDGSQNNTNPDDEYDELCRAITGDWCNRSKVVGYCRLRQHSGYLTKHLMESHQCIEKGCTKFYKCENAQYWVSQREKAVKKEERKIERSRIKSCKQQYLDMARQLTLRDPKFYVVGVDYVAESSSGYFVIWFIKFGNVDYSEYIKLFKKHITKDRFYLKKIQNSHAKRRKIIEAVGVPKEFD